MSAVDLAKHIVPSDQTVACSKCGRSWWAENDVDDPALFHEADCPLFGRRDVAALAFNLEAIEKDLGRCAGTESDTAEGWRRLAALYVRLHKNEQEAHYGTVHDLFEDLGEDYWSREGTLEERIVELRKTVRRTKILAKEMARAADSEKADRIEMRRLLDEERRRNAKFRRPSQDHGKFTAAIRAVEALPQGEAREALTFAVMQWHDAAFVDHSPLTPEESAFGEKVAARIRGEVIEERGT